MLFYKVQVVNMKLHSLYCSCNNFLVDFMFFSSLSSCSTRVSNEIGAGQPQAAKRATRVVMYMALSEGLVISFTMFLLRNVWGYMYSNEQEVVTYIARMLPILGISFFIDGLHSSLSGRIKMHCT